jgi:hypothetical protein
MPAVGPARYFYLGFAVFMAALAIYAVVAVLRWASRKWWTGSLILDASKPRSRALAILYLGCFVLWLVATALSPKDSLFSVTTAVFIVSGASVAIGGVLEIRERGIFFQNELISWNRIRSWSWEDIGGSPSVTFSGAVQPQPAMLKIELVRPLFFRRAIRIRVPAGQTNAFSKALDSGIQAIS